MNCYLDISSSILAETSYYVIYFVSLKYYMMLITFSVADKLLLII
jgi:hypothetical protein